MPSSFSATPLSSPISVNVPSRLFLNRKLGVESLATYISGQRSLSKSAATDVMQYLPFAFATPDFWLTSVNVPSPLLWNSSTLPGENPRGLQFTGMPFQLQYALSPGFGIFSGSNCR